MDNFKTAFNHILLVEGGFSNRKEDLGGPTKYGITQKTYSEWKGSYQSLEDVLNMPLSVAEKIYRENYWDAMNLSGLDLAIQFCLFDQGVNRGPSAAVKTMQKVLKVRQDGLLGPVTKARIQDQITEDLVWDYLKESLREYVRITQNNPSQTANLMGWTNRILNLADTFVSP